MENEKFLQISIPEGYEIDKEQSSFEKIVFKKKDDKYPKTWEDCVSLLTSKNTSFGFINTDSVIAVTKYPQIIERDFNILPSKEIAEKFLILQKLYTCRQAYIGDWKPDWKNYAQVKYCILCDMDNLDIRNYAGVNRIFSFPTKKMAEKFLENFNEDLSKISYLL
jgi:hypothetical protein